MFEQHDGEFDQLRFFTVTDLVKLFRVRAGIASKILQAALGKAAQDTGTQVGGEPVGSATASASSSSSSAAPREGLNSKVQKAGGRQQKWISSNPARTLRVTPHVTYHVAKLQGITYAPACGAFLRTSPVLHETEPTGEQWVKCTAKPCAEPQ